ncbi:MAG: RagB/SusD family nutrient uptake outer membrane protein [Breznakibacter sp.]
MKNNIGYLFFTMGCLAITSCSDMDDMQPEGSVVTDGQVTETTSAIPDRVAADLAGIYAYMGKQYTAYPSSTRADDFAYPAACISQDLNGADMVAPNSGYNWFSVCSEYADRNPTYANPFARYANFYNQLKLVNDLLTSIDPNTEDQELKYYIGQAKAVRAFDYLCLAPYFQFNYETSADKPCVPIVTETTTNFSNNPRATVREVYELIISDLDDAIELLDGFERSDKTKIDQQVAYGLRARANLYMGKWAEAAADADKALAGYTPYSISEVSTPAFYNLNDHNWMWGLLIEASNLDAYPTWPSKLGSFSGDSYTAAVGVYKMINPLLFNKIPTTDVRKGWWVDANLHSPLLSTISWNGVTGDGISTLEIADVKVKFTPYTNVKFGMKSGIGSTTNDGDWSIMRAEEMILVKAEGLAMSNDMSTAKQVLVDFIQGYRDPSYSTDASTAEELQLEIWKQRRIELWGEGFALSDIMRLNKPVVRVHSDNAGNWPDAYAFNIQAGDEYLLLRFPQRETNTNLAIPSTENTGGTKPVSKQNSNLTDGVTD